MNRPDLFLPNGRLDEYITLDYIYKIENAFNKSVELLAINFDCEICEFSEKCIIGAERPTILNCEKQLKRLLIDEK